MRPPLRLFLYLTLLTCSTAAMADRYAKLVVVNDSEEPALFEVLHSDGSLQKKERVGAGGRHVFTFGFDNCKQDRTKDRIIWATAEGESRRTASIKVAMGIVAGSECGRTYSFSENSAPEKKPICGVESNKTLYYLEKSVRSDKESGTLTFEGVTSPIDCSEL